MSHPQLAVQIHQRHLGTNTVVGWRLREKEMRWDSLFITSPLFSFEKLKNIKGKLFFSVGTLRVIISSFTCLLGIGLTIVKQGAHISRQSNYQMGSLSVRIWERKNSQTPNILKIQLKGFLPHQDWCYLWLHIGDFRCFVLLGQC